MSKTKFMKGDKVSWVVLINQTKSDETVWEMFLECSAISYSSPKHCKQLMPTGL